MENQEPKSIFNTVTYFVAEGVEKTEEELKKEYDSLANETRQLINYNFKSYCELRSRYRYE